MHEIEIIYKENKCEIQIKNKNPYTLVNLEEYWKAVVEKQYPHCDFIYIWYDVKAKKYQIFMIELKGMKLKDEKSVKKFIKKVLNKFFYTLKEIKKQDGLLRFYNIQDSVAEYYCVLVLPEELLIKESLLTRLKVNCSELRKLKNYVQKIQGWITFSRENIWTRIVSLF